MSSNGGEEGSRHQSNHYAKSISASRSTSRRAKSMGSLSPAMSASDTNSTMDVEHGSYPRRTVVAVKVPPVKKREEYIVFEGNVGIVQKVVSEFVEHGQVMFEVKFIDDRTEVVRCIYPRPSHTTLLLHQHVNETANNPALSLDNSIFLRSSPHIVLSLASFEKLKPSLSTSLPIYYCPDCTVCPVTSTFLSADIQSLKSLFRTDLCLREFCLTGFLCTTT